MSTRGWAARLPLHAAAGAATLRLQPGVLALVDRDTLWLRGASTSETLEAALDIALKKLPIDRRYTVADDGTLTPVHSRLPDGKVPAGNWIAAEAFFTLKPQPSASTTDAAPIRLQVVPSSDERPAGVLLTTLDAWIAFASSAPAIRLKSLRIAVAEDSRTIVRGQPIPSIDGVRFAEHAGIAVRCGAHWSPAVDASIVRALFRSTPDDLVLLHADGTAAEHIHADEFARASRSGARLMQEAR